MNDFEGRNREYDSREGMNRTPSPQRTANRAPTDRRTASADRAFSERREAPPRPMQNNGSSRDGYYGENRAQSSRAGYGSSQSRNRHRSGRGNSSVKKHGKRYTVNPTLIMIILSVLVTTSVIVGVSINYRNKVNDTVPPENEGQNADIPLNNGVSLSQTLELYSLDRVEVEPELDFPKVKIYDSQGRVVFSPVRNKDGKIDGTFVYEYNDEGACVVEKLYGPGGVLVYKDVSGGKNEGISKTLYETQFDGKNNFSGYTETLLDDKGGVLEKVQCSYNGVVEGKYYYEYDDAGRVTRENRYTTYGELSVYTDYKYDAFGNVIEKIQRDPSGKEVLRDVMTYDGENRILREEHYTVGVCKSYADYVYNSDGSVTKTSYMLKDEYTMTYVEVP